MGVQLLAVEFGGNLSNAYEALDMPSRLEKRLRPLPMVKRGRAA